MRISIPPLWHMWLCGACSSWILCAAKVTSQLHKSKWRNKTSAIFVQYAHTHTHTYLYMQQDCARAASRVATVTSASPSRIRTWSRSRVRARARVRVRVWGSFKCLSVKSGWTKAAAAAAAARLLTKLLTQLWGMPQICVSERERESGWGARCTALLSLDRRKMRNHRDKVAEICNIQSCCCCCCCLEIPAMQHARCICKFWIIHTCDEEEQLQQQQQPQPRRRRCELK